MRLRRFFQARQAIHYSISQILQYCNNSPEIGTAHKKIFLIRKFPLDKSFLKRYNVIVNRSCWEKKKL